MTLLKKIPKIVFVLFLLCSFSFGQTVKGEIVQQHVDAGGNGYSLVKVWGTYTEMGHAHGYLLADVINVEIASLKKLLGVGYAPIKKQVAGSVFPVDATEEINGIISGILAKTPSSTVDAGDLKVLNTYVDWGYTRGCRSHSCWGSYVSAPVKTLSTRRADYSGAQIAQLLGSVHFMLCAYLPSLTGKIQWFNFGIPGIVISGTGVNEYGTMVSVHDGPGSGDGPPSVDKVLTRSVATRLMMTADNLPNDISKHVDLVYSALQPYKAWTGSFLNYYVPEGHAGVISCEPTQGFNDLRKPKTDYFGGEVIVTSNTQTNGHSTPSDFPEIDAYYNGAKPKALPNHWGILDVVTIDDGAQLMSVEYRNRGDMTIWCRGRLLATKTTPKIVVEWSNLFRRNRY
jgi:hypothetical protein